MVDVPRRLTLSGADKVANLAARAAPGSHSGNTQWSKPPTAKTPTPQSGSTFAVVEHGDDGTVERPAVTLVYWVGAATPANGEAFDFWYTADV